MDLRYRRQQVFDVAAPARGVLALPVAADRPIEHTFDPAANPARRLRLGLPNRFEDLHDERRIDGLDRKIADDRIDLGLAIAAHARRLSSRPDRPQCTLPRTRRTSSSSRWRAGRAPSLRV